MTYQFKVGDYVKFTRIVKAAQKVRFSTDYSTGRPIAHPEIPEQVLPQTGSGQITKLAKSPRKVKDAGTFTVATVAAGKPLGNVTAILDDAILVAVQESLFDMAPDKQTTSGPSQYGTDAKGLA